MNGLLETPGLTVAGHLEHGQVKVAPYGSCKVLEGSIVRFSAWAPSGYIRRAILFGYCAGIFKLLRSLGIDSASQCSLGGRIRYF
jgi:hypothetical protein